MTNRDLYGFVATLGADLDHSETRGLEQYLRALWSIAREHSSHEPSAENVRDWIASAATASAPEYDPRWGHLDQPDIDETSGYHTWEQLILFQVADLHRMRESGQLDDEFRYYGVESLSGASWYNFDVGTYLECAVEGSVGGYVADGGNGDSSTRDAGPSSESVVELESFGWALFAHFLHCGATYE